MFIHEEAYGKIIEIESRDIVFLEKDFPKRGEVTREFQFYEMEEPGTSTTNVAEGDMEETHSPPVASGSERNHDSVPVKETSMEQIHDQSQPRRSVRDRIPRRRYEIEGEAFMIAPEDDEEPKIIQQALSGPKAKEWTKAMEEEMESMKTNQVWDLVNLPLGRKSIGNKWVLKIKRKADGTIDRYKARLVAKGYT